MNAIPDEKPTENEHLQLDLFFDKLSEAIKGLNINKNQEVTVTFKMTKPEHLYEYLYTSDFLEEEKVIEKYRTSASKKKEVSIDFNDYYEEKKKNYLYKLTCKLKPKTLIKYMEDTSRIPKYWIKVDEDNRLIMNNKYILAQPRYGGAARDVFEVIYNNERKRLTKSFIEKSMGEKHGMEYEFERRLAGILADLGFKTLIKKIFFPDTSEEAIYFQNNVFANEIKEKMDYKKLDEQLAKLKLL